MKYQGRKNCKTTNNLVICDNKYHILAISDCISGHHHDSFELVENIDLLMEILQKADIDYHTSHLNADGGFDTKKFIETIEQKHPMIANIPRNKRNSSKIKQEYRYLLNTSIAFVRK